MYSLWTRLFRSQQPRRHQAPRRRSHRPRLGLFESRIVPTTLDLSGPTAGLSGTLNGALFTGATKGNVSGSGVIDSFVRIDQTGVEQGYNTDARPYTDPIQDAGTTATFNHALQLKSIPVVASGTTAYYEFALDINQTSSNPLISLDALQISTAPTNTLQGWTADGTFGGQATLGYDLGAGNHVLLNYNFNPGSGNLDLFVDVPVSNLGTDLSQYVYLYSQFGTFSGTGSSGNSGPWTGNDGFEEWARGKGAPLQLNAQVATSIVDETTGLHGVSSAAAGDQVYDTATVIPSSGNLTPSGTVTYYFYNTSSPVLGTTAPVYTSTVTLSGGSVPNSADTSASYPSGLLAGQYSYIAVYSGDSTYIGTVSAIEPLLVTAPTKSPTGIVTSAIPTGGTVGAASLEDTATLSGISDLHGDVPGGTITFTLYAPDGNVAYQEDVSVAGFTTYQTTGTGTGSNQATEGGTYEWVASYSGDTHYDSSASNLGDEPVFIVRADTTTTTAVLDANGTDITNQAVALGTIAHDTSVTSVVESVSGIPEPSGTVSYYFSTDGGATYNLFDTESINSSSIDTSALAPGNYSFEAQYNGDDFYNASPMSAPEPFTINQGQSSVSTTIFDASGGPVTSVLGESVYDTAAVTGSSAAFTPTGYVQFSFSTDGGATYTPFDLEPVGSPSMNTAALPAGSYSFEAQYLGDGNYAASPMSDPEPLTINQGQGSVSTTILDAVSNAAPTGTLGESVYDTASVTGSPAAFTPTGTVTYYFYNTATPVYGSTTPVSSQQVTIGGGVTPNSAATAALGAGSYAYIAVYSGDGNYSRGIGPVEPLTINQGQGSVSTTILDAATNAAPTGTLGESVYDTASVTGSPAAFTPTGTVTYYFYNTATPVYGSTTPVSSQQVTISGGVTPNSAATAALGAGSYAYIAVYSGDGNYSRGIGPVEPLTISKVNLNISTDVFTTAGVKITGTTVAEGTTGITVYDTATLGGSVSTLVPSGTVTYYFYSTSTPVYGTTVPVFSKQVTLTSTGAVPKSPNNGPLGAGSYSYIAVYNGNGNYNSIVGSVEPFSIQLQVARNEAATIGFWANNNGQALLKTYTTSAIGNWLASTYANLFGNLTGATGAQVASYYLLAKNNAGTLNGNLFCQAFDTALSVWVTTTGLGWNTTSTGPKKYGFQQGFGGVGLGSILYNVGNYGASFGVANNTYLTVGQILSYLNSMTARTGGSLTALPTFVFYGGKTTLMNGADTVLNGINNTGDIV